MMHYRHRHSRRLFLALALAAVGAQSSAQAEEEFHSVLPALANTTLSGFVDTSALWNWQIAGKPAGLSQGSFDDAHPLQPPLRSCSAQERFERTRARRQSFVAEGAPAGRPTAVRLTPLDTRVTRVRALACVRLRVRARPRAP